MSGATPPLLQYAFMMWCSVKKEAQGQLYCLPLCTRKENMITDESSWSQNYNYYKCLYYFETTKRTCGRFLF